MSHKYLVLIVLSHESYVFSCRFDSSIQFYFFWKNEFYFSTKVSLKLEFARADAEESRLEMEAKKKLAEEPWGKAMAVRFFCFEVLNGKIDDC